MTKEEILERVIVENDFMINRDGRDLILSAMEEYGKIQFERGAKEMQESSIKKVKTAYNKFKALEMIENAIMPTYTSPQ